MSGALNVSVALCTHNGEAFIEEQLASITRQILRPIEIVLSDDASTDRTVELAHAVVESWNRAHAGAAIEFRVLRNNPALGVTKNFERAIGACRGDLIALCDQDDVWHEDKLDLVSKAFDEDQAVLLVHTDARLIDASGAVLSKTLLETIDITTAQRALIAQGRALEVFLRRNFATGATVVFRKELRDWATPFPPEWLHDEWLAIVAAAYGGLVLLSQATIDYRLHGANQVGASTLTLSGRIGRLTMARTARNERLRARAEALQKRAPNMSPPFSDAVIRQVAEKAAHERFRHSLPVSRIRRFPRVAMHALRGRYSQFGGGLKDVVRDIVQPAVPSSDQPAPDRGDGALGG